MAADPPSGGQGLRPAVRIVIAGGAGGVGASVAFNLLLGQALGLEPGRAEAWMIGDLTPVRP
jgi:hypothetical protein